MLAQRSDGATDCSRIARHAGLVDQDPGDGDQQLRAEHCLDDVFKAVLEMDGTISGEHGIGLVKRGWVGRELDSTSLKLMQAIKAQFDPDNIMNPDKAFPVSQPESVT